MNPLLSAALGTLVRALLFVGAGWLVKHGIWTAGEADSYVAALTMFLLAFGWSLWKNSKGRARLLKALDMPSGTTEEEVKAAVKLDNAK